MQQRLFEIPKVQILYWMHCKTICFTWYVRNTKPMEDGGVDMTVVDGGTNHLGQMADFHPLLTFLFIKTWCTSNQISDHTAHMDELS